MRGFRDLVPFGRKDLFDFDWDEFFSFPAIGTFFPIESRGIRADVKDLGSELLVEAELPGFEKDEIEITLRDNYLTIQAERKEELNEEKEGFIRRERSYGKLQRTIALPYEIDADKVEAKYQNGILKIKLPKVESEKSGRRINITD
ncbi:MAG TPA: hypothetical protein DEA47_06030 [Peptococcaceae bacterium]|nr:MAG: Heat shock protein Hsp20 [Clostridia bacterium 41_269]HBT20900.1 hypothetical protein [Peptococcaceae bacterium]